MKPVAIVRYAPHEGPGYFAAHLDAQGIPWRLVRIDEGEPLPQAGAISGLAMMGGAMSVNDDLTWIAPMLDFVRESVKDDVPVIGHCLGGQLLAKALGGEVTRNPVKEIGWGVINVLDTPLAREWGPAERFLSYHWHGERFSIPRGATRIWASAHCEHQAFVYGVQHLAMQCHIEMTAEMIEQWCVSGAREIERHLARSPAVQSPEAMRERLDEKLRALNRVADRVYARWTRSLSRA
jgi:GMP synthase-like glutamine amidotransferase